MSRIIIFAFLTFFLCHYSSEAKQILEYTNLGTLTSLQRNAEGSSYYLSNTMSSWGDAQFSCHVGQQGKLLSIEDERENDYVASLMIKHNINNIWTSGAYDASVRNWRWFGTGEVITYAKWGPVQPNGNSSDLRVAVLNELFDNYWVTFSSVSVQLYSICETKKA